MTFATVKSFCRRNATLLIAGAVFAFMFLAVNWAFFVTPLVEDGDLAANAVQVQSAKHFHELLGNYSRWGFHHPGPFFFYLYGAGEAFFYNLLHIVPAPLNAEYIAQTIFSIVCLFLTFYIFRAQGTTPLFPPLAILSTLLFLFVLGNAIPGVAMLSLWMPYASLFCFLLLTTACASVASGRWEHTPLLAFSAMVMIHSHVAQAMFTSVLAGSALVIAAGREIAHRTFRASLRRYRKHCWVSAGIIILFLLPIVLDILLHKPNNIDHIRDYLGAHGTERNSLRIAALYVLSYFTYITDTVTLLANPRVAFHDILNSNGYVPVYWGIFFFATALGIASHLSRRKKLPSFVKLLFYEQILVVCLFFYWAIRITGGMYNFNGFFFYSTQLSVLLGISVLIADAFGGKWIERGAITLSCALCMLLLSLSTQIRNRYGSNPDVLPIVSALKARGVQDVELRFEAHLSSFLVAPGVASYLRRSGIHFCVPRKWAFVFEPRYLCLPGERNHLHVTDMNPNCRPPCETIYHTNSLEATFTPKERSYSLPLFITSNDDTAVMVDFNDADGGRRWTTKHSEIQFTLKPRARPTGLCRILVTGGSLPNRDATVELNRVNLGTIKASGPAMHEFQFDSQQLVFGGENVLAFDIPNAGPVNQDRRELGYLFDSLEVLGPGDLSFAKIAIVPARSTGPPISGTSWHPAGGWKLNGYYQGIGNLAQGDAWGSWNGNDAFTGQLVSGIIASPSDHCIVVPVGHGPSIAGQNVYLTSPDGKTVATVQLKEAEGKWNFYEIRYDTRVPAFRIVANDEGSGRGQWLSISQPLSCSSSAP